MRLPLILKHVSLLGYLVSCQIVNRAITAHLLARGLTVSTKWHAGPAFLLTPKSKLFSFFSLHIVNLVGTGKAIHLMNALIKIIDIHIIMGQFSPAIIHHALWYHDYTFQGQCQISKLHTLLLSRIDECRISEGRDWGKG